VTKFPKPAKVPQGTFPAGGIAIVLAALLLAGTGAAAGTMPVQLVQVQPLQQQRLAPAQQQLQQGQLQMQQPQQRLNLQQQGQQRLQQEQQHLIRQQQQQLQQQPQVKLRP